EQDLAPFVVRHVVLVVEHGEIEIGEVPVVDVDTGDVVRILFVHFVERFGPVGCREEVGDLLDGRYDIALKAGTVVAVVTAGDLRSGHLSFPCLISIRSDELSGVGRRRVSVRRESPRRLVPGGRFSLVSSLMAATWVQLRRSSRAGAEYLPLGSSCRFAPRYRIVHGTSFGGHQSRREGSRRCRLPLR